MSSSRNFSFSNIFWASDLDFAVFKIILILASISGENFCFLKVYPRKSTKRFKKRI